MKGLLIGPDQIAALQQLREAAAAAPVDMTGLLARLKTPAGKNRHRAQMTKQSVELPIGFLVCFSIETGHPNGGVARHLSVSLEGRLPHPLAVWVIAQELGFTGELTDCAVWPEVLEGHGHAVNVAQRIEAQATETRQ